MKESFFKIFPNPVNNILNIKNHYDDETTITLYDLFGRLVLLNKFSKNLQLDLSNLMPGVYVYTIEAKNKKTTGKIIKQ